MARMIPNSPMDTESAAERRLFERLRDETPDELVAFHSVAWQVPGEGGKPKQGECDFVLAHPDYGVLTLEVKGGSIRYDARAGKWFTIGKSGESAIKDPVRQAQRSSHLLGRTLARAARHGGAAISYGHAVAFPDCRVERKALRPELPRELVLDHRDISHLCERVEQLFRYWFARDNKTPLGSEGVALLERVLANSFELRAPMAYELAEEERELYRLTEQQYRVLDMLSRHARVAIAGCAGSGKTFLAAEKARRLAAQGFRVLLVVFNVLLAEHLRRGLADMPEVTVRAFYGLCREIAEAAGFEFAEEPEPGAEHEYYPALAATFSEHADVMAGRFDALIVDEGQDVSTDWWLPLQILLTDADRSPLYVFFDDNQKLFPVPTGLLFLEEPFLLTDNLEESSVLFVSRIVHRRGSQAGHGSILRGRSELDILWIATRQCRILSHMDRARITRAGQLSLPARIRRRWGTTSVSVEDRGDSVVLRPIPDDPVAAAAGFLKGRIPASEEIRARAREDERVAIDRREQGS